MYTLRGQVTSQDGYYITLIVLGVHLLMGVTPFTWLGVSIKKFFKKCVPPLPSFIKMFFIDLIKNSSFH